MFQDEIKNQLLKVGSVWAVIGVTSWTEAAAFVGFVYSTLLICEWVWKKVARPLLMQWGYIATPVSLTKAGDDE